MFFLALVFMGAFLLSTRVSSPHSKVINVIPNLTSSKSNNDNKAEVSGVYFETVIENSILSITEKNHSAETHVQLGVRITNKTHNSMRFCQYRTIFPDLIDPKGIHLRLEGGSNRSRLIQESDCPLIHPEENVTFFLNGILTWKKNKLQLVGSDEINGLWYFDDLESGVYGFRFLYYSTQKSIQISYPEDKVLENIWVGQSYTPISKLSLVLKVN